MEGLRLVYVVVFISICAAQTNNTTSPTTSETSARNCTFDYLDCHRFSDECMCRSLGFETSNSGAEAVCYRLFNGVPTTITAIHSEFENNILVDMIADTSKGAWIGLNGDDVTGYAWRDGSPFDYNNIDNSSKPDDSKCFTINPITGMWLTKKCDVSRSVVCRFNLSTIVTTTTPAPTTATTATTAVPIIHQPKGSLSTGYIILIVVSLVVMCAGSGVCVGLIVNRKRKRRGDDTENLTDPEDASGHNFLT